MTIQTKQVNVFHIKLLENSFLMLEDCFPTVRKPIHDTVCLRVSKNTLRSAAFKCDLILINKKNLSQF